MPPQRGRRTWPLNAIGSMNDFSDVLPLVALLLSQHTLLVCGFLSVGCCFLFRSLVFFLSFLSELVGSLSMYLLLIYLYLLFP